MLKRTALVLLVGVAGCKESPLKVSAENALVAGQVAGVSAEMAARHYSAPPNASNAACGAGTFTDADLDGWPDSATTLNWTTCGMQSPLGIMSVSGSLSLTDTAVGTRSLAHIATAINRSATVVQEDEEVDASFTSTGNVTGTAPDTTTWAVEQDWSGTIGGDDADVEESIEWTVTYTAGGWQAGATMMDGSITFDGDWSATVNGESLKADVWTINTVWDAGPLVLTASCSNLITAGALRINFDNGERRANIDVIWNGCNDRTVDTDL